MVKYQSEVLDATFDALRDGTRRRIVERLLRGPSTVTELARPLSMSLPGVLKHVRVLEEAGIIRTEKTGRTRRCRIEPQPLGEAASWLETYRTLWENRLDRLTDYLGKEKE